MVDLNEKIISIIFIPCPNFQKKACEPYGKASGAPKNTSAILHILVVYCNRETIIK